MMELPGDGVLRGPVALSSPEWHEQALKDAERALAENRAAFVTWDGAKMALRNSAS